MKTKSNKSNNLEYTLMTAGKYFNRAVMALDAPHIGFVVRETPDKIVVFGDGKDR